MLITLKTFDGHNLNDASYKALLLNPHGTPSAVPVYIPQNEADAVDADTYTVDVQTKVLSIEITSYANRHALISQLKGWFKRGTRGDLVGTFSDDGVDYQINCRVVNLVQDPEYPMYFRAILQTGRTAWRSVALQTDTWNVSGAGGNKTITVGGDDETHLIAELTATVAPGNGYFYQNFYRLVNVPGISYFRRPWCILLDTAALITAGKMRADCFDLRLYVGGAPTRRWIANPQTTTTKIWFNVLIDQGFAINLLTAINSTETVTSLQFAVNATTQAAIKAMPISGIVYHGTELFWYSGKDDINCKLTIIQRGVWGTTKQAHAAGDPFNYIQNQIRMVYGKPTATNPALDDSNYDDTKPLFNLSTSDNNKWVYDNTSLFFHPTAASRLGKWLQTEKKITNIGNLSRIYIVKGDVESGDPALGIKAGAIQLESLWKPDTVELVHYLTCPGGFSKISATGRKYRSGADWMPKAAFQRSDDGKTWYDLWTEASPSASATFENWSTHTDVTVANTSKWLRHVVIGIFPGVANGHALTEALTVTVEFVSANIPTGAFLGESGNSYTLALKLSNDRSGDIVGLDFPALFNLPFLMDGENSEGTFDKGNAHDSITLLDHPGRPAWLRLKPGSNVLTISATDIGTLSIALSWYRRRL